MKSGEKLQNFTKFSILYTCYENKMVVNKKSCYVFKMIEVTQYNYSTKLLHRLTSRNFIQNDPNYFHKESYIPTRGFLTN